MKNLSHSPRRAFRHAPGRVSAASLRGVTLIEIAIVLVIVGLLLGGILKGTELIDNARIRSIVEQQSSLKLSWHAFKDRYDDLPGNIKHADLVLPGAVRSTLATSTDGFIAVDESPIVFQHLTAGGYLRCGNCTAASPQNPDGRNSPTNQYGGAIAIFMDSQYYATTDSSRHARLFLQSGARIPSNIIRDVDLKMDDSLPVAGDFVNSLFGGSIKAAGRTCMSEDSASGEVSKAAETLIGVPTKTVWLHSSWPYEGNCGGALKI